MQPDFLDLRYFKLGIMLDKTIYVQNIKGLHHQLAKIKFMVKTQILSKRSPLKTQDLKHGFYIQIISSKY